MYAVNMQYKLCRDSFTLNIRVYCIVSVYIKMYCADFLMGLKSVALIAHDDW